MRNAHPYKLPSGEVVNLTAEIHDAPHATRAILFAAVKVGERVLVRAPERRVYRLDPGERFGSGGPLLRGQFYPWEITGETRVSWLCDGRKIPKKTLAGLYSQEDVERLAWVDECWFRHAGARWAIEHAVNAIRNERPEPRDVYLVDAVRELFETYRAADPK